MYITQYTTVATVAKVTETTDLLLHDGTLLLYDLVADPLLHRRALLTCHILALSLLNLGNVDEDIQANF